MKKPTLQDVCARGYFPEGLPPAFETVSYAAAIAKNLKTFRPIENAQKSTALVCRHNLARNNGIKRVLAIVNPLHFFRTADCILDNWKELDKLIGKSKLTRTRPRVGSSTERAIIRQHDLTDMPRDRARIRATSRFILQADIERFFPSIYTHSISWAIHSKATAKAKKNDKTLLGNILDRCVRDGQDGQTIGIPIGPDTSRVLAELILSQVDLEIPENFLKHAIRYVDDYEFAFDSKRDADRALSCLSKALARYELAVNPRKTKISELPAEYENIWVSELRLLTIADASNTDTQAYTLYRFFERAYMLAKANDKDSVTKYAVARLRQTDIAKKNWFLAFNSVTQCMVVDPSCLERAFEFIELYKHAGYSVPENRLKNAFNKIVQTHAPLAHGSYVAWALWGCLLFDVKISKKSVEEILGMEDAVVGLLLLHAVKRKLATLSKTQLALWDVFMKSEGLTGEMWLLSYEAKVKGWLESKGAKDHIKSNQVFEFLRNQKVQFYNEKAIINWRSVIHKKKRVTTKELPVTYI